ncbi:MAG: NTF2 fold immunity protein [Veillonella sp.]
MLAVQNMALDLLTYIKNVYGNTVSINQKPYRIIEEKDVWIINGAPPKALGGNFI